MAICWYSFFGCDRDWPLGNLGPILASEFIETKNRNTVLGILQACASGGFIIAALMASWILPIYSWRGLYWVAIIPGLISLLAFKGVREPPSWIAAKKKTRQTGITKHNEFAVIWNTKTIRRTFILWALASTALQFGYFGANNWFPTYLVQDLGVNQEYGLVFCGYLCGHNDR